MDTRRIKERGRRNVRRSGSASCLHARAGVSLNRERDRRSRNIERTDEDNKKNKIEKKKRKGFYEQRRREDLTLPGTHTSETIHEDYEGLVLPSDFRSTNKKYRETRNERSRA